VTFLSAIIQGSVVARHQRRLSISATALTFPAVIAVCNQLNAAPENN
jgi:hypothetical protein